MKLQILAIILLFSPLLGRSQNLPACDSVFIDCCTFDISPSNTLSIQVSNYSSNIFSYPGFILFNTNLDTVAFETVNYYGIGWDQTHTLDIIHPFNLPFEGTFALYTGFYESLACTFPVVIQDTALTRVENQEIESLRIFPNPADEKINLTFKNQKSIYKIRIAMLDGSTLKKLDIPANKAVDISDLKPGFYIIYAVNAGGTVFQSKFIKK